MSNLLTNIVKRCQMSPSEKSCLMAIADAVNEAGEWSISTSLLMEWTCLGKTAVLQAVKKLEAARFIEVTRATGRTNLVRISLVCELDQNQSTTRTSPPDEPVRQTDGYQSATRTTPVRQTDGTSPPGAPITPTHQSPHTHQPDFWKAGVQLLSKSGMNEIQARRFLGMLARDHGDQALQAAVNVALAKVPPPADPRSYLREVCSSQKGHLTRHAGFDQRAYEEVPDGRIPA